MNFRAGIHVLIKRGDKFLVLKTSRTKKEEPNTWDLPGGSIEWGEQPMDSAAREVKEEAGIKVEIKEIIGAWALKSRNDWSVELIAFGVTSDEKIKTSSEHSAFAWLSLEEMKKLEPKRIHLTKLFKKSLIDLIQLFKKY